MEVVICRDTNCRERVIAQFDASRRGKKVLKYPRDKKKAHTVVGRVDNSLHTPSDPGCELRMSAVGRGKEKEKKCENKVNGMTEKDEKKKY